LIRRVVPDLKATEPTAGRTFYEDVLGMQLVMDQGWVATYADPANPTAQITVVSEDASAPVAPDVSVEVDDVDTAYAAALAAGHEIVHSLRDEPWGVRRFFVRSPEGAIVNVVAHR
jgi:catechol 2,3-dioxygenase-like lactoylglutathione lyase family enzyme